MPFRVTPDGRREDPPLEPGSPGELALIARIVSGEKELYARLMRRYNQRIFRVVRAIIRNDDEAEDIVQHAYMVAYRKLETFRGESTFSTWITRISIHEAPP